MKIRELGFLLVVGLLSGCATFQETGQELKKAGGTIKEDFKKIGPAMKEGFTEMGHDMKTAAGEAKASLKETFK
ncbi:MAG: hypothetical protein EG828_05200 [Deltaproteobacteria bacterium]|nr:hypothetical protein [Deltaproteobacteria bacterium]